MIDEFKTNLIKIKNLSSDFEKYLNDKNKIELDLRNLKAKYRQNKVERDVFSEYNKRLESVNNELNKVRDKILSFCNKNREIINNELKNAI